MKPLPPIGYRYLQVGEILEKGDLYLADNAWYPTPVVGVKIIDNKIIFVRRR